jgi:hypothetical protein
MARLTADSEGFRAYYIYVLCPHRRHAWVGSEPGLDTTPALRSARGRGYRTSTAAVGWMSPAHPNRVR